MLDIIILLTFILLVTLVSIRFEFGRVLGIFGSVVFVAGLMLVLISYLKNRPNIKFSTHPVREERSSHAELYTVWVDIENNSDHHLYSELVVYLEEKTISSTDLHTELFPYAEYKKGVWPRNPVRIDLAEHPSEEGSTLATRFPLLVENGKENTKIKLSLHVNENEFNHGLLSIFNPVKKYHVKDELVVDLNSAISNVAEDNQDTN